MFQKRSVRNKFILFTSLLTILPVGILAGFKTNFFRQRLSTIEQTNTNSMNTATKNEWEEKAHSQVRLSAREITRPTNEHTEKPKFDTGPIDALFLVIMSRYLCAPI